MTSFIIDDNFNVLISGNEIGLMSTSLFEKKYTHTREIVGNRNFHLVLYDDGKVSYYSPNIGSPVNKIDFGVSIKQIACGSNHILFLDETGFVWGFGHNGAGQLGLGDNSIRDSPVKISSHVLPLIEKISCCNDFSLALDFKGNVWSTGSNAFGQLGQNLDTRYFSTNIFKKINNLPHIIQISSGNNHCMMLDINGYVWSCGRNSFGELGLGDNYFIISPRKITNNLPFIQSISCGESHSLLLDIDMNVWSCGNNKYGQLGINSTTESNIPQKIKNIPPICKINAFMNHSLLLDDNGNVWTFGNNYYGQLGLNDTICRKIPIKVPNLYDIVSLGTYDQIQGHSTKNARNI